MGKSFAAFGDTELSEYKPSMREKAAQYLSSLFGGDKYTQQDTNRKLLGIIDFVPGVGEALAGDDIGRSLGAGNYTDAAVNIAAAGLGAMPVVGDVAAKGLKKGIRAFHGSPQTALESILANPPVRQFDNGTSALGAFLAPTEGGAKRYAGETGRVYEANVNLEKPYEMPVSEFLYLQDITRGKRDADGLRGASVGSEQWGSRQQELIGEGSELRKRLEAEGYDGVYIRDSKGNLLEIASFKDVPLSKTKAD